MTFSSGVQNHETAVDRRNKSNTERYRSWGRYPRIVHRKVSKVYWRDQLIDALHHSEPASLLPYGMGRSYGDSCLNSERDLIDCSPLNRILDFDWETGRVRAEGGTSLADLLEIIVPQGWFLPVTPGTKFVTVGGAIANDVHGKNHHRAGTFGCHLKQITLFRSDAGRVDCSLSENADLFRATIGGLGLTGVIASAELQLKRIPGNAIEVHAFSFANLEHFLEISQKGDQNYEYTVAWIDCLSAGQIRGIFFCGNHNETCVARGAMRYKIPFAVPEFVLNKTAVALFNRAYYRAHMRNSAATIVHYDPFFYPLDSIQNWNLLYGRRGLAQYQCVVPGESAEVVKTIIKTVSSSGEACFLAVLKAFGDIKSPGLLSFPRSGLTLALDLPMRGGRTLSLLQSLDELVLMNGGALYPAKDARMKPAMFKAGFPNWAEFAQFIDPQFSSSFWRRVTAE
jgi:FAD/FMN-containing dehydrogenase